MTSLSKKLHRERRSVENPSQGLFRLDRKRVQAYASLFLLPPTTFQMRDDSGRWEYHRPCARKAFSFLLQINNITRPLPRTAPCILSHTLTRIHNTHRHS